MQNITRVTAAILINDEKIIIAKRKATDKLPNKWEFPGGKIEKNETAEQCLKREIKEEFDIVVSVVSVWDQVFITTIIFQLSF